MADCTNHFDIECSLQNSPIIDSLKAKDQQLQMQVDNIKDELNRSDPIDPSGRGIKQRLADVEACCDDKQEQLNQVNTVISEIGDNITLLKGMSTRQDIKIKSLLRNVIIDETYLNFSDRVENVYIPQGESLQNIYTQGDIYMNVNQNVGATNAVYVCIRMAGSKGPLSANDWQELYYSAPADVITILGIDPVEVTHPYKHEWVISIRPEKLADMMANLDSLDLSHVDVTLGDVYFNPIIKESVTIQENLTVGNTATVNSLKANDAQIKKACIEEMTCDTKFTGKPEFLDAEVKGILDVHEADVDVATIDEACINKMTCNTDFTDVIPTFGNAKVNVEIETNRLEGNWAHIKKACIEELVCDTQTEGKITMNEGEAGTMTVNQFIQQGGTAVFNGPTEFKDNVILNTVEGDTTFHDAVEVPDVHITNNTTTENLTVNNLTEHNGPTIFNSYVNYLDSKGRIVCVGNVLENLYRPSFGMFDITGSGTAPASNGTNNLLYGLGSDAVEVFNRAQGSSAVQLIPLGTNNRTNLIWDQNYTTPGVEAIDFGQGKVIQINGDNGEDDGLYTIEFNMTIEFSDISDNTPMNIWSHRAGVVVFDQNNVGAGGFIIDDKTTAAEQLFKYTWTHNHRYYDQDTGEDSSGSSYRNTENAVFNIQNPDRCNPSNGWSDVVLRCGNHYTYTKTLTIPVTGRVIVAPYFKPSAGCENKGVHFNFTIPTGVWNTGSKAQIFVHKVEPLNRVPYEYHC